LISSLKKLE